MRNSTEEIRMQSRTFVLPKAGVAFDQNSEWPADKCTALDVQKSVVIVGANGSGKTRLGTWIDLYSPQKESTLRVSAQRSLTMPDSSQLISLTIAESDLIYGYGKATENQNPAGYKLGNRWASNGPVHILNDFPKLMVYLFSEQADVSAKYLADSRLSENEYPRQLRSLNRSKICGRRFYPIANWCSAEQNYIPRSQTLTARPTKLLR